MNKAATLRARLRQPPFRRVGSQCGSVPILLLYHPSAQAQPSGAGLIPLRNLPSHAPADPRVTCDTCTARCCRLQVMLLTDTGVPERYIEVDAQGSEYMARLDDGWCAALDRNTLNCTIYDRRPLICREFEMGGEDCLIEQQGPD